MFLHCQSSIRHVNHCSTMPTNKLIHNNKQQQQPFYGPLSGTTRVSRYQKKHSPTHHPDHHPIFISFFHLLQSIASSLLHIDNNLRQQSELQTVQLQFLARCHPVCHRSQDHTSVLLCSCHQHITSEAQKMNNRHKARPAWLPSTSKTADMINNHLVFQLSYILSFQQNDYVFNQAQHKHSLTFRVQCYVVTAMKPMHQLKIRPIVHNQRAPLPFPQITSRSVQQCGNTARDRQTDRHTHTHTHTHTAMTNIHFTLAMPHAKCNKNKGKLTTPQNSIKTVSKNNDGR